VAQKMRSICASFSGDIFGDFPDDMLKEEIIKALVAKAKRKGVEIHVIQDLDSGEYLME